MGNYSDVKIFMAKNAFVLLKNKCINFIGEDSNTEDFLRELIVRPSIFEKQGNAILIGWNGINYNNNFDHIKVINNILYELDCIVEDHSKALKDYFYRFVETKENGEVRELTNDKNKEFTSRPYIEIKKPKLIQIDDSQLEKALELLKDAGITLREITPMEITEFNTSSNN